jgi:hypothetical protein
MCLDAFLTLWVGGMMARAAAVLLGPLGRVVDALAVALVAALGR